MKFLNKLVNACYPAIVVYELTIPVVPVPPELKNSDMLGLGGDTGSHVGDMCAMEASEEVLLHIHRHTRDDASWPVLRCRVGELKPAMISNRVDITAAAELGYRIEWRPSVPISMLAAFRLPAGWAEASPGVVTDYRAVEDAVPKFTTKEP